MKISFITANYVARESNYALRPFQWGPAAQATVEAFHNERYAQKSEELLKIISGLGFEYIEVWVAHLDPWRATPQMIEDAVRLLKQYKLQVVGYTGGLGAKRTRADAEEAYKVARAIGSPAITVGLNPLNEDLAAELSQQYNIRYAHENHPESSPEELLRRLEAIAERNGNRMVGTTADTGLWALHGADPVKSIYTLKDYLYHVHLKDINGTGADHATCALGDGVANPRGVLEALQDIEYTGSVSIEHEPAYHDPTDEVRVSLERVRDWLG